MIFIKKIRIKEKKLSQQVKSKNKTKWSISDLSVIFKFVLSNIILIQVS